MRPNPSRPHDRQCRMAPAILPSPHRGEGAERSEADEGEYRAAHYHPRQTPFGRQLPRGRLWEPPPARPAPMTDNTGWLPPYLI